jgi:hypothetical protein
MQKYENDEGLISTKYITVNQNKMLIDGEEVTEVKELRNLVSYLKNNNYLWQNLKLKLEKNKYTSSSSAPIVGVSFDKALEIIISKKQNPVSPRFRLDMEYSRSAIYGTLFADFRKNDREIVFQLWQIFHLNKEDINIPTSYIHGIFDIQGECFTHFDGALIFHSPDDRKSIENGLIPPKKAPYYKLFRLDCRIEKDIAKEMMSIYLPIEELNDEFGLRIEAW